MNIAKSHPVILSVGYGVEFRYGLTLTYVVVFFDLVALL